MREPWQLIHGLIVTVVAIAIFSAIANFGTLKKVLVGKPMRSRELREQHTKLYWLIALPILAADLYSSVAYGPEAGITELAGLGPEAKWFILPITLATVILLTILIVSYIMGVIAYPNGGGAYAIAKDNFRRPVVSLIAASALLIDYILTVAVSVSSGIQTLASAYPLLAPYQTMLSLLCVLIILLVNLRGVQESATVFAWPTLIFMACMLIFIGTGLLDDIHHGFVQPTTPPLFTVPQGLTALLVLKAFSSASSSLTGIETISNAVPIFRENASRGAIKAYMLLGTVTGVTLLGFAFNLYVKGVSVNPHNTMLSQLASIYFGHGFFYQVLIWGTLIVLVLAANSTFTGFPQLAALVASDSFLPRALRLRGDRLGYSNGMILLAALSALLIEAFQAQTNALIPLYAIGVFVAFTVAQTGLTRRWSRVRGPAWQSKAFINATGAIVTALVAIVFAVTKFTAGAWIVVFLLPFIVLMMTAIRKHYDNVADQLRVRPDEVFPATHHVVTIILVSGVTRVVLNSIAFAQSLNTDVIALYIGFDDESIEKMEARWEEFHSPCRLVTIKSEYRSLLLPLSRFIGRVESWEGGKPDHINLVIAQFIPKKGWQNLLHNQTSFLLRAWFLRHKDVIVTTVPYHLNR